MKEKYTKYLILVFISCFFIIFTINDYFIYKTPILNVISVNNVYDRENNNEIYYKQNIDGIIKNGKYKGKKLSVINETSSSSVFDNKIHKGVNIFVELSKQGETISSIIGIKRDIFIIILLVIFVDLLIIFGEIKGLKTLLMLIINILVSAFIIFIYDKYKLKLNILIVFIFVSILFIILSLLICNGKSKKTLSAIISSIISLFISFLLSYIVLNIYNEDIAYWTMDYVEALNDYKNIFYVSILLSGLGAIMDISITMASSLEELIIKNKNISFKNLKQSGIEISKDIIGTMTNVMLYTCYVSVIPITLLALKNQMYINNAISTYGQIEMIRVLTSSISIVISIPISLYVSLYIFKRRKIKC